jgi:hypothetical protein
MSKVNGLWVYQTLDSGKPDPDAVARHAKRHGLRWLSAQAVEGDAVLGSDWLREMRRATRERGLRLGVHGYIGRPQPRPVAEAKAFAKAIDVADADFAIVDAEIQYEVSPEPDSRRFVDAYRARKPHLRTYFSSFGRPQFHAGLDWKAWADGGFLGMPQAYENLNASLLKPSQCVDDWARFFDRKDLQPTLGCFSENGHGHLGMARLVQSVRDVPRLHFNVYRHGTATDAEIDALTAI